MSEGALEQKVNAFLQQSELLAANGRNEDALALVDEALSLTPEHPMVLAQRAWLLNCLGRSAAALEAANAALYFQPDLVEALVQLSVAQNGVGDAAAAEGSLTRGLELAPEYSTLHFLYAQILASNLGDRTQKKRRRALAEAHVDTGLALSPEDPDGLRRASNIAWTLGKIDLAQYYLDRGLSFAPESIELLALRADLATAAARPTSRFDVATREAVAMAEANKILLLEPQHRDARRKLFSGLWYEHALLTDVPIGFIAGITVTFTISFRESGTVWSPFAGTVIVLIAAAVRLLNYFVVTSKINPGFKKLVTRETRFATVRRALSAFSWLAVGLCSISAEFVRDAVAIRWILVGLALAAGAALAASVMMQYSFSESARRAGGYSNDVDSLSRIADYRRSLRARVILRTVGALFLTVILSYFSSGGREDAAPVGMIALAAMVLSPLIGVLIMRRTEKKIFEDLPTGTVPLPEMYRKPGIAGLLLSGVVGCIALAILATNIVNIPVLPNENDAIGSYVETVPSTSTTQSECRGRPANRLACIIKENKERTEIGYPGFEVTDIDISDFDMPAPMPDLGDFSDLGQVSD